MTKTQIITDTGSRWRRDSGRQVGARSFARPRIEVATDRHRDGVEHRRLVNAIDWVWSHRRGLVAALSLATLRTMAEALEADPAVEAEK